MAARVSGEVKVLYSAEDKATPVGKKVQGGLQTTGRASDSVAAKMKKQWLAVANVLKVAVVAAAAMMARQVVRSFREMVTSTVQVGNELDKFARQSGMAVDELQRLKYAAEQMHLPFETLSKTFPMLARYSKEAARGMDTYAREFRTMGVDVVDSNGKLRSTYDLLLDMSEYMKNEAVPAHEKLAVAQTLLGRRGAEMIPFLKQGREEIKRLGEELERVGGLIDIETVAIAKSFGDQSTKAQAAIQGIKSAFATDLLPYLYAFRDWVIKNLPQLRKEFADFGSSVGKSILLTVQVFIEWIHWIERLQVAWDLMVESMSIALRKIFWSMEKANFLNKERAEMFRGLKEQAEQGRKEAIQRQKEGLSEIDKWLARSAEISKMIDNIDKTRSEMIKSGSILMQEAAEGEVVATLNGEGKKTAAVDKAAKEREQIYQWLADKEMELQYEGAELRRQQIIKEYTEKATALRILGDYIGALRTEVMLAAELAKIDSAEEAERLAKAKKKAADDMKAERERAEDDQQKYLKLLNMEADAYKEMVALNKELRDIRKGMYEDSWGMMMETANLAGGDLGRFAGMAMTGMKSAMDTGMGTDQYSQQMEQMNAFYDKQIEAMWVQYERKREVMLADGASQLEIMQYYEETKQQIQQSYLDRDLQMTGLQQAQKLEMYQSNVNFTMGILGMLGSFADEQSQILFAIEKAAAVASIIINSHKAAALALATVPPPAGQALASKYLLWGKIMAAATAAMAIKQIATGTTQPGAMKGGAGYEYTQPETEKWAEEKPSKTINVYVYGHIVDQDAFARELIPSLDKAFEDGVH